MRIQPPHDAATPHDVAETMWGINVSTREGKHSIYGGVGSIMLQTHVMSHLMSECINRRRTDPGHDTESKSFEGVRLCGNQPGDVAKRRALDEKRQ